MIKIPYGISNFTKLIREGRYFVDRTHYLEQLENFFTSYVFFVRPRRFGKSLFLSVLEHYYGLQYKEQFDTLFGKYYIGRNPTPLANQYLILKFDFSQMDTSSFEKTQHSFLQNAKSGGLRFLGKYSQFFDKEDIEKIDRFTFPSHVIQHVLLMAELKAPQHKIYLLIDEYDHFANEILSFRFNEFINMVGKNGFVRKFYEAIKVGTQNGVVDRLFITGVSPLTLDSLTSGFNIATNISLYEEFHDMMGFREEEVKDILRGIEVGEDKMEEMLPLMKRWYDGYLFAKKAPATQKLYNSDMVLYFASEYMREKNYPENLLDPNIATDYNKIRRLFKIKGKEKKHLTYLEVLLETGEIKSALVRQYEIVKRFDKKDFISLLYYTGITTIDRASYTSVFFKMPNYVIKELYYQYFHQILLERSQVGVDSVDLEEKALALALDNDLQPIIEYTESILTELSNRDKMKFDEKYIKIIFTSIFFTARIYTIRNEVEVKKSTTEKGYADILLIQRPPFPVNYQFVIELKYVKKMDASQAEDVQTAAVTQLKEYLQHDDYLQSIDGLRAYVVMFVGNEGRIKSVEID
ncbi:MAG: AAA family ATPase [Chitinophagales bacterium]